MPIFFICFIVFILWLHVKTKQTSKKEDTWDQEYWAKERQSNFVRKKDISELEYIQVTQEDLPVNSTAQGEEKYKQDNVLELLSKKMINLSGMNNADIKLAYGTANFTILSSYDQNYTLFVRNLNIWGHYIYKNIPSDSDRAMKIFEYAISIGSDISETWVDLGRIYMDNGAIDKVQELIETVEDSEFYLKDSIITQLKALIRNYT